MSRHVTSGLLQRLCGWLSASLVAKMHKSARMTESCKTSGSNEKPSSIWLAVVTPNASANGRPTFWAAPAQALASTRIWTDGGGEDPHPYASGTHHTYTLSLSLPTVKLFRVEVLDAPDPWPTCTHSPPSCVTRTELWRLDFLEQ